MVHMQPIEIKDFAKQETAVGPRDMHCGHFFEGTREQPGEVRGMGMLQNRRMCRQRLPENPFVKIEERRILFGYEGAKSQIPGELDQKKQMEISGGFFQSIPPGDGMENEIEKGGIGSLLAEAFVQYFIQKKHHTTFNGVMRNAEEGRYLAGV